MTSREKLKDMKTRSSRVCVYACLCVCFFFCRVFFSFFKYRLDICTTELLEVIAACATPQLASTPLRDLANLTWAFAVQRQIDPDMMAGVGREVGVFTVLRFSSSVFSFGR